MKKRGKGVILTVLGVLIFVLCRTFILAQNENNIILNGRKMNSPSIKSYIDIGRDEKHSRHRQKTKTTENLQFEEFI